MHTSATTLFCLQLITPADASASTTCESLAFLCSVWTASCLWIESTHLGKEISWFCSWLHRTCIKSLPPGWVCTDLLPVLALWCVLQGRTYGHEVCTTFYELESLKAHLSTASQSCNRFWNAVWLYQGQYSAMVLSFVLEMVQNATVHFPRS